LIVLAHLLEAGLPISSWGHVHSLTARATMPPILKMTRQGHRKKFNNPNESVPEMAKKNTLFLSLLLTVITLTTPPITLANPATPFVRLALDCVPQEYPNKIAHTMQSGADQGTPRSLHPVFYGCFDWHSSVHGHWLLTRFARLNPQHELAAEARTMLDAHLTPTAITAEVAYLQAKGRSSWERPYGLAWLLQLATELHEWNDPDAQRWSSALDPLEAVCAAHISSWLPELAVLIMVLPVPGSPIKRHNPP